MYSGITKAKRIAVMEKMQLVPAIISIYRTAETSVQDSYAQTMLNMPNLMDILEMKVINISDLNVHRICFNFHLIKRCQISGKHSEKREIEITHIIVAP